MGVIYYKFRSERKESVLGRGAFPGALRVGDARRHIASTRAVPAACLRLWDAQTLKEYDDDHAHIRDYSAVLVRRGPCKRYPPLRARAQTAAERGTREAAATEAAAAADAPIEPAPPAAPSAIPGYVRSLRCPVGGGLLVDAIALRCCGESISEREHRVGASCPLCGAPCGGAASVPNMAVRRAARALGDVRAAATGSAASARRGDAVVYTRGEGAEPVNPLVHF